MKAVRRIQFCAGHRVKGHESKCANIHGHNYVLYVHAESVFEEKQSTLDEIGRVIDFSVLKERIGGWIDQNWDHRFLAYSDDDTLIEALNDAPGRPPVVVEFNPTAENMASHLLFDVFPDLMKGSGVMITRVILWETENCYAEVDLDDY